MAKDLEYLVDSYCHLFIMADISLYQTIRELAGENGDLSKRMLLPPDKIGVGFCFDTPTQMTYFM